ncbi:multiprotein-bridging factor 1 family protein [Cupriavidus sp. CuC1]
MTQEDLAERIGTSVNTIGRMEDGHPGTALPPFCARCTFWGA